jgi:carbonic anhydrase
MERLLPIKSVEDILPEYQGTPISRLLEYHNLNRPHDTYEKAHLLIGMCMDNRNHLKIPDHFSYIIRAGGANLRYSEFKVSYAIAVGGVKHIALIGHNNCAMVNLSSRKKQFIDGLVEKGGWDSQWAEEHFNQFAPMFEIGNEIDFTLSEVKRLRQRYPKVIVAPMIYSVENGKLFLIKEN